MKENNTIPIKKYISWKHLKPRYTTTFNTGDIVPFFNRLVNPNDYMIVAAESITNMSIPNYATMDLLYQDITFFGSPLKLVFDDWDKFFGEDLNNPYIEDVEIFLPQISCPNNGWEIGTLADYMYLPTKQKCKSVCALPFRIFALIVENYFRDEQREEHYLISKGQNDQTGTNGNNYYTDLQNGGKVPKAAKLMDYFTGTKLEFQAGDPVKIPLGTTAPVTISASNSPMLFKSRGAQDGDSFYIQGYNANNAEISAIQLKNANTNNPTTTWPDGTGAQYSSGLYGTAILSEANAFDIRSFKISLMTQQYLNNLEDGGTRYIEQIYKRWGIFADELELQIPQYLGGHRFPLNMEMIAATNQGSGDTDTYQFGAVTGVSNTRYKANYFKKHFKQHSWVFGITCIRPLNTYQQGIDRQYILKSKDDFFKPEFSFLGPDIVYNYEIYSDGTADDDKMFGVRNYGDYLRFMPNKVSGQIRKNSDFSQDYKTYALYFNERPINNVDFIKSEEEQVDKTLLDIIDEDTQEKQHQFTFQIQMDIWIRQNLPKNGNGSKILRI